MNQQQTLTSIFSLIGHPSEDHQDLMLLFYAGMIQDLNDDPRTKELDQSIQNALKEYPSESTSEILLSLSALLVQHDVDQLFHDAFWKYLHSYTEHIAPALPKDKAGRLEEIMKDTH